MRRQVRSGKRKYQHRLPLVQPIVKGNTVVVLFYSHFLNLSPDHRCIQNLTKFVQPILDGICAVTGWKVSLIAGGPEPSQGGRLNMIRYANDAFTG